MQAQDRNAVLLALSLRAQDRPTEEQVADELSRGTIVRNRPSRGTLQVTAPEDLHWLTALMSPRSNAAALKRRDQIGVTDSMIDTVGEIVRTELANGRIRTRSEIVEACAHAGVTLDGSQAGHVLRHHTEMMTIVFAGQRGRTDTFALADDWIGERRRLERPDALAELAIRYFAARGPATAQCLGWWANLAMGDVRDAIADAGSALEEMVIDETAYVVASGAVDLTDAEIDAALAEPWLLPAFDEYLLGYRDRAPVIAPGNLDAVVPGRNGMFKPVVVVDGEVVGLWSKRTTSKAVTVTITPFDDRRIAVDDALTRRVDEYGAFLGLPATVAITDAT